MKEKEIILNDTLYKLKLREATLTVEFSVAPDITEIIERTFNNLLTPNDIYHNAEAQLDSFLCGLYGQTDRYIKIKAR